MPTDEDLARGVQQGSEDDLRQLIERHHEPFLGFLFRMTAGDRTLAQDLVQESFVRMMRAIRQYEYPRPFKPWLYAIGANLVRDYYGQAEMRHTESAPVRLERPQMGSLSPERLLVQQETLAAVTAAVSHLPPHQRAVLLLRYREGMSLAEIAATLEIPLGTVKSRLSLALKQLRQNLRADGQRES